MHFVHVEDVEDFVGALATSKFQVLCTSCSSCAKRTKTAACPPHTLRGKKGKKGGEMGFTDDDCRNRNDGGENGPNRGTIMMMRGGYGKGQVRQNNKKRGRKT